MRNDFCAFILSHGRANNIKTLKALQKGHYTGRWYIVIDNEDDQEDEYRKRYPGHVLQFDKLAISKTFDTADTEENRRTIVYARNACFDLAKEVGCKYFLELDDDYNVFEYKVRIGGKLKGIPCTDLDRLFTAMIEYLESSGAVTIAFAQGGDFIGGKDGTAAKKALLRKAMNTFFCSVDRPFQFVGRINEDVNTYTRMGQTGKLVLTITDVSITQTTTQKNAGGMSGVYIDGGTYLKSFYSVLFSPSCVTINAMGDTHKRIHHNVHWRYCAAQILNERYKKGGTPCHEAHTPTASPT